MSWPLVELWFCHTLLDLIFKIMFIITSENPFKKKNHNFVIIKKKPKIKYWPKVGFVSHWICPIWTRNINRANKAHYQMHQHFPANLFEKFRPFYRHPKTLSSWINPMEYGHVSSKYLSVSKAWSFWSHKMLMWLLCSISCSLVYNTFEARKW